MRWLTTPHGILGPVDVEKQCGVILPNGQPCARSLTCKSHSMGAKRAVPGRSLPYDMLLAAYQKKNQAKQQSKLGFVAGAQIRAMVVTSHRGGFGRECPSRGGRRERSASGFGRGNRGSDECPRPLESAARYPPTCLYAYQTHIPACSSARTASDSYEWGTVQHLQGCCVRRTKAARGPRRYECRHGGRARGTRHFHDECRKRQEDAELQHVKYFETPIRRQPSLECSGQGGR
jgi:hypothetical protein